VPLRFEAEDLKDDGRAGIDGAGECAHSAGYELLDGGDEFVLRGDLKEHARFAHAVVIADLHRRAPAANSESSRMQT
jgi:hypothetical protein